MPERRAKLTFGRPVASVVALALAAAASLVLAVGPMGMSETVTHSSDGSVSRTVAHTTLLETNGKSVLFALAVPVLLAALPLLVPRRHRTAAVVLTTILLAVFVFLAILSVGVFFVPALVAAVVAAGRSGRQLTPV